MAKAVVGQRQPRIRESEYLGWVAKLPCLPCLCIGIYTRPVHVAHVRNGSLAHGKRSAGMQEKSSDKWCLPICPAHHTGDRRRTRITQHHMKESTFWDYFGVNPFDACIDLHDAYENGQPGASVIARHAAMASRTTSNVMR